MVAASIGLHHAGVDGEALALDKTGVHARPDHRLEYLPEDVALAEAAVAIDRECRVIGDVVVEIEPAEPPVGKVQFNLLAQPSFKADAVAVTDNQHPDHQLRIDRGTANVAIKWRQPLVK